jgi:GH25 family lysozyme M1 (1,4-beta-N-acetylmuramidase)/uncharacterized protein YraI
MKGIDVSKYQGAINWASVRADGIGFAMIRAGYGMYPQQKDPYFDQNVLGAQSQGIHTGAYLYSYAKSVEDAQREADVFLDWIQPYRLDYPVAFDIEDASQENLSRELLSDIVTAFCTKLEAQGYYVMLYANKYWLQNKLIYDRISRFDIWLAQYAETATYDQPYGMWQYTSSGKVNGIRGGVDLNTSYKDYVQLIEGHAAEPVGSALGIVTADLLNVRAAPSTDAIRLRQVARTNEVDVLAIVSNGWLKVNVAGLIGYVFAKYIQYDPNGLPVISAPSNEQVEGICTANLLNVRAGAGTQYRVLFQVAEGNSVNVMEERNGWYYINCLHGKGWCSAQYIDLQL